MVCQTLHQFKHALCISKKFCCFFQNDHNWSLLIRQERNKNWLNQRSRVWRQTNLILFRNQGPKAIIILLETRDQNQLLSYFSWICFQIVLFINQFSSPYQNCSGSLNSVLRRCDNKVYFARQSSASFGYFMRQTSAEEVLPLFLLMNTPQYCSWIFWIVWSHNLAQSCSQDQDRMVQISILVFCTAQYWCNDHRCYDCMKSHVPTTWNPNSLILCILFLL